MPNKINNEFTYKITVILLYFIISLSGLSILFIFSPRKLLLNDNSEDFKSKIFLFKDFAKNIYENINTPLIKNITLTKENEECPKNFKPLVIKNQYYGNFTKFYGNKSICIERMNDTNYSYHNLLKILEIDEYIKNKKECGELSRDSNKILYVPHEMVCPLTYIEFLNEGRAKMLSDIYYFIDDNLYLTPIHGNLDIKTPVIINLEIINNVRLCVEKHIGAKDLQCEFPDNNQCYIQDNGIDIPNSVKNNNQFYPSNLAKWNLVNDDNIEHNFCNKDIFFHILAKGYINFNVDNLNQFKEEFPSNDFENNSLYKMVNIYYKYLKNIDRLFYLLSFILLCCSLLQFILLILLLFQFRIRKIYIVNGIFLFIFKLLSFLGMIINHYYFYLKIEKVYIVLIDKYINKVIEKYLSTRNYFIIKIVIFSIIGYFIVCVDYIILIFSIKIKWGIFTIKYNIYNDKKQIVVGEDDLENNPKIITNQKNSLKFYNINTEIKGFKDKIGLENQNNDYNNNKFENKQNPNQYDNDSFRKLTKTLNSCDNSYEINLKFVFKDRLQDIYEIKIQNNLIFNNVIKLLKEKYPELKEKKMKVFQNESNIINKDKTINDNGISDNTRIIILA